MIDVQKGFTRNFYNFPTIITPKELSHRKQSETRQHVEVGELPLIMHPDCSRSSGSRVEREEEDITERKRQGNCA